MTIPCASDCYTYYENDPLHGKARHIPTNATVDIFLVLHYESKETSVVGSKVPGSFNTEDFVTGGVSDFQFDQQGQGE